MKAGKSEAMQVRGHEPDEIRRCRGSRPIAESIQAKADRRPQHRAALHVAEVGPERRHVFDASFWGQEVVRSQPRLDGQRLQIRL